MTWYSINNKSKWGISEIQYVVNRDLGIGIKIDINWKWGTFDIETESKLDIKALEEKYSEDVDLYREFEDVQMNYLDSGTEDITFWDVDFKQECEFDDGDRIIEAWQEDGWNALYDNGFDDELDADMWIVGGLIIEETNNPYEL
jgi:hypothetical protein